MFLKKKDTFKCSVCNHIFRNYKEDGIIYHSTIYRYTDKGRKGSNEIVDNNITEVFHKRRIPIVNKRYDFIKKYIDTGTTVIDIGGGAGTFANRIKSNVKSVDITEVNPMLVKECRRLGFKTYEGNIINYEFKKYDIVTLWHVLEHIQDPIPFINKIKTMFRKYLIIEIPTLSSKENNKKRGFPPPNNCFDGHYHYFTYESLKNIFKDFKIVECREGVQTPAIFMVLTK
tara:strand:+ start:152 stop:838 length:687 start_codon:yes stop_codon:yes gene_type:complete